MLGAIIGDIVGSRFEFNNLKSKNFDLFTSKCEFTDDSVMTLAVAQAVLDTHPGYDRFAQACVHRMQEMGRKYPSVKGGYGGMFSLWLEAAEPKPYGSYGNGSAMRVSACGFAASSMAEASHLAEQSASVTHNHLEGIKGAVATAECIFMARHQASKEEIKKHVENNFYRLDFSLDEIRPGYDFDVTCQGSVPQSIVAFLESADYEDAIRNAISIGGDSDTLGAITGGIAGAFYGIPDDLRDLAMGFLKKDLIDILAAFEEKFQS